MLNFKTKLQDKKEIAEGTMAFYVDKPEGFEHRAGQFVDVTLLGMPEGDNVHAFSIASAPDEDKLMIATRIRSESTFKQTLKNMAIGSEIEISEPIGDFVLHNDKNRIAVFLIGGIGITPVRSMIVDATHRQLPNKIFLFYSIIYPY